MRYSWLTILLIASGLVGTGAHAQKCETVQACAERAVEEGVRAQRAMAEAQREMESLRSELHALKDKVNNLATVPTGAVGAFSLSECPHGWQTADGRNGRPDLAGRFPLGFGRPAYGGPGKELKQTGGASQYRLRVWSNSTREGSDGPSISGIGIEWSGENRPENWGARIESTPRVGSSIRVGYRENGNIHGEWTEHLPPFASVLFCVKQ
jgi:hypothetical protein